MKKFLLIILITLTIFNVKAVEFDLNSKNAILYNEDTNEILYEKDSEEKVAIASLTKIMTAIVAVENIKDIKEQVILVNSDFTILAENNASVAGFKVGEKVTYEDLLYGLLLPSGADSAQALTRLIAGGRSNFVKLMNEKALALGLTNTNFVNETGLDAPNHYSTVKDVATMFSYALKNSIIKKIMETSTYKTSDKQLTLRSTISNFKVAYNLDMPYILGGKTGTTSKAGRCLASFANYNDINYILVTVGAEKSNQPYSMLDAEKIYTYFLNNYGNQTIIKKGDKLLTLKTINAKEKELNYYASKDIIKYVPSTYSSNDLIVDYKGMENVKYNTKKGTKLGTLTITYQDEEILKEDIFLEEKLSFDVFSYLKDNSIIISSILASITLIIVLIILKKKKL